MYRGYETHALSILNMHLYEVRGEAAMAARREDWAEPRPPSCQRPSAEETKLAFDLYPKLQDAMNQLLIVVQRSKGGSPIVVEGGGVGISA